MDLDLTWLLWGLPLAFALGWVASRLDLRQWRMESQQTPKAYFRGLNHLLNEQQDQAIDAFIEAVQGDPDTAELDRKSTRLNSSHNSESRMPSSA
jgi:lipopolysaccharide biosynthesis regulator YciM